MRTIIFSNYDSLDNPYYAGGGALAIHSVARRLASRYNVTVLTGKYPGSKNEIKDSVKYRRVGISIGQPQIDQLLYQIVLPFYVVTQSFDIWFESFTPPFSTAFLPWFTKKPVVGVTHLLGGKEMSKKYHLPFHWVETLGLRQYKNIVVLSEFLAQQIRESKTNAKVSVIPNGLDSGIFERTIDKKEEYILFLGRIDVFHKGLDVLLDAYKEIADLVKYKLFLAGSGALKEVDVIKKKIKKLELEDKVLLLGKVDDKKKFHLLEHAIVTIIPSRVEGFAIVALEAMASKSPLVISKIPGLDWIPNECAIRAKTFDAESFAEAIMNLVENPDLRESMGEAGYRVVQQYNWDNVANLYGTLIERFYIK